MKTLQKFAQKRCGECNPPKGTNCSACDTTMKLTWAERQLEIDALKNLVKFLSKYTMDCLEARYKAMACGVSCDNPCKMRERLSLEFPILQGTRNQNLLKKIGSEAIDYEQVNKGVEIMKNDINIQEQKKIVSLSGKARAGKDTIGEMLHGFKRYAFADTLKKYCAEAFDLPLELFHNNDLKDKPFSTPIKLDVSILNKISDVMGFDTHDHYYRVGCGIMLVSPRHLLQFVGTDLIRKCVDDDFWINKTVQNLKDEKGNAFISDSRFSNERKALKTLGAKLVLVKRDNSVSGGHVSENDLGNDSEYDMVIDNNGSLEDLKKKVKTLI